MPTTVPSAIWATLLPPGVDLGLTTHSVKGGINYHVN
jgi:hypothetical protein